MHKVPVGVLGASGYAGRELCGLIAQHPGLELAFASANEQRGQRARIGASEVTYVATEDAPLGKAEVVFTALPHGAAATWVGNARATGARVVDLSSDFRPGVDARASRSDAPYGLTELMRSQIPGAGIVANPGCYPTAILIAIAPLLTEGWIVPGATITATAASGVTGAGYSVRPDLLFAEVAEDYRAYSVGNEHRHLAEMRAVAAELGGQDNDILFTPHLLPVARGILATITVPVKEYVDDPAALWRDTYQGEPFIEIADQPPSLRDVVRRNVVRLSVAKAANMRQPTLIIISAIDNLMKGAAGQALQNANVLLGLREQAGLPV
ncbi:MAG TPA: N-acetyl-gamma-glutamyl-phosphate reductase [Gemmatimonadaceae bacterium]|nr:N-acetyl-gamma-glutamyl-phosphate reductase [Gemmatimonadaceae bacterium]